MRKTDFHMKAFALGLVLKQGQRKLGSSLFFRLRKDTGNRAISFVSLSCSSHRPTSGGHSDKYHHRQCSFAVEATAPETTEWTHKRLQGTWFIIITVVCPQMFNYFSPKILRDPRLIREIKTHVYGKRETAEVPRDHDSPRLPFISRK